MSTEENKVVERLVIEEIFNKRDLTQMDNLIDANYVQHGDAEFKGREGLKEFFNAQVTAFPDFKVTIEDMVAEGDKVTTRYMVRGTHKGDLMGIAPTGKQVSFTGVIINRMAGGKEVEGWQLFDRLGLMQQLGVVPPIGQK